MKKMAVKNFNNFNNGQRSVSYSLFSIKKSLNELLGYMVVVEQSPELSKKQYYIFIHKILHRGVQ